LTLQALVDWASDKTRFKKIADYIDFAEWYLDFKDNSLQAVIVSQNERNYCFYQYRDDGHFNITRPINSNLIYPRTSCQQKHDDFLRSLKIVKDIGNDQLALRNNIIEVIYTVQQCVGAALDALPAGQSNKARKVNGDLFERLVQLIICETGASCRGGTVSVPVEIDGKTAFNMNYQHDLLITDAGELKVIGSVKTSSKDRIDKIFMDKFLYCKLTETALPHIAIFLNDVQRKNTTTVNRYGINSTFLPGHFKGFTIKLNPLDGVYYCDIRPNMRTEPILRDHIKTIDYLLCEDLWTLLEA